MEDIIVKPYAAGALEASATVYCGFSLRETAGATAVVRVWDSASAASGTLLDTIAFAANESKQAYYVEGLRAQRGVFLQTVSGAVEGSVRVA